jgi:hypothetical protein
MENINPPSKTKEPADSNGAGGSRSSLYLAIEDLPKRFADDDPRIEQIALHFEVQGRWLLIFVIGIPFVQPIPLPGLSIVLGVIISFLALLGNHPSRGGIPLPSSLAKKTVKRTTLARAVKGSLTLLHHFENFSRPGRMKFLSKPPYLALSKAIVFLSGIALALPIPPVIPFSNSVPAWSILMICSGLLLADGLLICGGWLMGVAAWLYFAVCWHLIAAAAAHFFS